MKSAVARQPFRSSAASRPLRSEIVRPPFASRCPEDKTFRIEDLMAFKRGRGDLLFSILMLALALFFLAMFWGQTGWENRKLPADMGTYLARQFGLIEEAGQLDRLGRILKQSWVAPFFCLLLLVPAALLNLRASWLTHTWRKRFDQPVNIGHEVGQWLRALEFVGWFVAYTLLVPILGYLLATLLFGTALPYRMGYRSARWMGICFATSLGIVLLFRTGLQIRTPINIWIYDFLPQKAESFMKTWF